MTDYDYTFWVAILGDYATGKEELANSFSSGLFREDYKMTIGVDFYSKILDFHGRKIKLQIWDIGGEERFRFLIPQYLRGQHGAVIMYNITNKQSFDHVTEWAQIVRENAGKIPILLVGNNLDLAETREVPREEGMKIAEQNNYSLFAEVSTNTGENVEELFQALIEIVLKDSRTRRERGEEEKKQKKKKKRMRRRGKK